MDTPLSTNLLTSTRTDYAVRGTFGEGFEFLGRTMVVYDPIATLKANANIILLVYLHNKTLKSQISERPPRRARKLVTALIKDS